jgi:hypothetical protein
MYFTNQQKALLDKSGADILIISTQRYEELRALANAMYERLRLVDHYATEEDIDAQRKDILKTDF